MNFKDNDLKMVLAAIEEDLAKAFDISKDQLLAKAEGDEPEAKEAPMDSTGEASDADPVSPASEPASPAQSAPAGDGGGEAPMSPPADASAPAEAPMDPAAQGQEAPASFEALQAEYSQLSPEELDMHIKAALAAKEALAASAGPMPGADASMPPQASAAPAMPAAPAEMPPEAMKAEIKAGDANGGKISKSEDLLALEAVIKSQNEDIATLTKAVTMVLERPERKAVTTVNYMAKSEPEVKAVTPAEARAKLNSLIPSLSKSERALVVDFYSGRVGVDKLTAILDKAK